MNELITIKKKRAKKGDDGYKIVYARMKEELTERLDNFPPKQTVRETS